MDTSGLAAMSFIIIAWYVLYIVQAFLSYGTAYRKTKANGDNGVSLFGWMLLYMIASIVPGLGIYLWKKSKDEGNKNTPSVSE